MRKIEKTIITTTILLLALVPLTSIVSSAGPNYMGFYTTNPHVTVTDSFSTIAWVDVHSQIDTAAIDNLTFLPAGRLHYTSTAQGDLFPGTTIWMTPEANGVIDNTNGYAKPIVWSNGVVNDVNKTLATITWYANSCGMVTLTIAAGGTAYVGVDPGTTKLPYIIYVHPKAPADFTATGVSENQIDLTWTKQTGMDKTLIRWSTDTYPTSVTDGNELYNDTGTSTSHTGLNPGDHIFYSAWGWNDTGFYSLTYQSDDGTTLVGNLPPYTPSSPSPNDGATDISVNVDLSWTGGDPNPGDTVTYDVYFGTSSSPPKVSDNQSATTYDPGTMNHNTKYYWQIIAWDNHGASTAGPVWSFTTQPEFPPENSIIKGYIKDENGDPLQPPNVIIVDFIRQYGNSTGVDDEGYYEINVWAGRILVSTRMDGYDSNTTRVNVGENEVIWNNITLYPENAWVHGYITDIESNPLENINIMLYNTYSSFLFPLGDNIATTDENGYYNISLHEGYYIMFIAKMGGGWPFGMGEYDSLIFEVDIPSGQDVNISRQLELAPEPSPSEVFADFSDWDHLSALMRMTMASVNQSKILRLYIDYLIGDGDYSLNQSEYEEFIELWIDSGSGGGMEEHDTRNALTVDDIYYNFEDGTTGFENFIGWWNQTTLITMFNEVNYTSNESIPTAPSHIFKLNVTYKNYGGYAIVHVDFPDVYGMISYNATNVTVTGVTNITILPGGDPNPDDDITWEWVEITAKKESTGGNGDDTGDDTGGDDTTTPSAPTADANGPYAASLIGGVAEVTFDGSGSSGSITSYSWDFGDNTTGTGVSPTHNYTALGNYTVNLTVTGPGGSNTNQTFAIISEEPNLPPTTPVVIGPQTGSKNIDYNYTAVSTDDDNDTLQYIFDWGDGTNTTTDFLANGTSATQTHNWSTWGIYTIKVKANDNKTYSGTTEYVVLIDVLYVKNIGYLIDTNSNGTYDKFYSNETAEQTSVEKLANGSYLVNSDTDSEWDWIYDPDTDTLTAYVPPSEPEEKEEDYTLWYVLMMLVIIIILLIIAAAVGKKKKPKEKPKKKPKK